MMNKTKSARRQLGRFLFLVPVLAIILLSFRKSFSETPNVSSGPFAINDTVPGKLSLNKKGYAIDIVDNNGECTVVVKDKNNKEVKRLTLVEWNEKQDHYEKLYGEIATTAARVEEAMKAKNSEVRSVTVVGDIATVTLKNGKTEVYTLSVSSDRKAFEERCGTKEMANAPIIDVETTLTTTEKEEVSEVNVATATIADHFEISDTKAKMYMRNGKVEEYNLADPKERKVFEQKFGKIITAPVSTTKGVTSVYSKAEGPGSPVTTTIALEPSEEVAVIDEVGTVTTIEEAEAIAIEPELLLTIKQTTTREELEFFKKDLKEKGFEFSYDKAEFKDGRLVMISGTVKSKNGQQSNFVIVDFDKIIISQVKKGEKTIFRVDEVAKKKKVS